MIDNREATIREQHLALLAARQAMLWAANTPTTGPRLREMLTTALTEVQTQISLVEGTV